MIGKFIRSFSNGRVGAKAIEVLIRTYGIVVDENTQRRILIMVQSGLADSYNEHEMAVHFLSDFIKTIDPAHPMAVAQVTKYIRIAKGARNRGFVQAHLPMNMLFEAALTRFGISEAQITTA